MFIGGMFTIPSHGCFMALFEPHDPSFISNFSAKTFGSGGVAASKSWQRVGGDLMVI